MIPGRRLKVATATLVGRFGKLENAAADCGKGKSTVHRWTDEAVADADFINVRDLATLELLAGEPDVTRVLCRNAGGMFVPLPDIAPDPDTLAGRVMELTARVGALNAEMAKALGDGTIDAAEARALLDLQARIVAANAELQAALTLIADAEGEA